MNIHYKALMEKEVKSIDNVKNRKEHWKEQHTNVVAVIMYIYELGVAIEQHKFGSISERNLSSISFLDHAQTSVRRE